MNPLLQQISECAPDDLRAFITEGHDKIVKAMAEAVEEACLQEATPKLSLGFTISVDLDKNKFDTKLKWSFTQCLSASHEIEDPKQGKLSVN